MPHNLLVKLGAIFCLFLAIGCAREEQLSVYESVRFKQSLETTDVDKQRAKSSMERAATARGQIEAINARLKDTATGVESVSSACQAQAQRLGAK